MAYLQKCEFYHKNNVTEIISNKSLKYRFKQTYTKNTGQYNVIYGQFSILLEQNWIFIISTISM